MSVHRHAYPSPEAAAKHCAEHILALLSEALAGNAEASLAVSGGSTPRLLFDAMAGADFRWDHVHLFWVDERAVPPSDPQSNYRLAEQHLIGPCRMRRKNIHRIRAELRPDEAARLYVDEIREFFGLASGELPHFDVMQRGMGADAHTASLFPGEPLIEDREGIAAAVYVEKLNQYRITLLPGVLLAARHTAMLVTGADKAHAVLQVFDAPYEPMKYPAQTATHHGRRVAWFLDAAAASLMD